MSTGDPGMFNRYAYTFNDPVNMTDPTGMIGDGNKKTREASESHFDRHNRGYDNEVRVYRNGKIYRTIDRAKFDHKTGTLTGVELKASAVKNQQKRAERQRMRGKRSAALGGVERARTSIQSSKDMRMIIETRGGGRYAIR